MPLPRFSVAWFAQEMEKKLQKHDGDKGTEGWVRSEWEYLLGLMYEKVVSLRDLIDDDSDEIAQEVLVDIGNYAMMLADKIRRGIQAEKSLGGGS